jgi:hypothetical protein
VFYLVTLVYPRCAQTCLQLFSFTKLDIGTYLSADFTILVRDIAGHWGKLYVRYLFPGIALMLVFAIGLPIWYLYIMWTVRNRLKVLAHLMAQHAMSCHASPPEALLLSMWRMRFPLETLFRVACCW